MNKLLVSILLGLTLAAANPAQAGIRDYLPTWLGGTPAQNQPIPQQIHPNIEAQQPQAHINLPAPAPQNSWFSSVFRNPLAGFYARFSGWWNNGKQKIQTDLNHAQREVVQYQRTTADLSTQVQNRNAQIAALTKELADVRDQRNAPAANNSAEQIQTLQKREKDLQAQLETLRKQSDANLMQDRATFAKIAAEKILENEKTLKAELDGERKSNIQRLARLDSQRQIQNETAIKSLREFSQRFNAQVDGFQRQAQEKLNHLDSRVLKIATAVKERTPIAANPLTGSITGDFLKIESTAGASSNAAKTDSERGFDKITEHIQMDAAFVREQISRGNRYAQKILSGVGMQEIPTDTQENYLQSIVALNWFFYDHALRDQKGFDEGTFVIEDKDFKFYNFFMDYIKKFNPTIKGDETDPLAHYSTNPYGYSRDASHFVHMKKKFRPYGIDMRLGTSGELPLLPASKKHMLFGIVNSDKQHIYVKPENHGIYYYDGLIGHIGEFTTAQARKSSLLRNLLTYCGYDIGTDDADNNRKERVPQQFLQRFAEAVKTIDSLKDKEKELLKKAKQEGIQTLVSPEIAQTVQMQELLEQYRNEYDNVEHRYGREIHITNNALLTYAGMK